MRSEALCGNRAVVAARLRLPHTGSEVHLARDGVETKWWIVRLAFDESAPVSSPATSMSLTSRPRPNRRARPDGAERERCQGRLRTRREPSFSTSSAFHRLRRAPMVKALKPDRREAL